MSCRRPTSPFQQQPLTDDDEISFVADRNAGANAAAWPANEMNIALESFIVNKL